MNGFTFKALIVLVGTIFLGACASLDKILPVVETPSVENQRASVALSSLQDLGEIDAYIRLNNDPLRDHISESLEAQALAIEDLSFTKLRVRFARQLIAIEGTLEISTGTGEVLKAFLRGDVILAFSGTHLIWQPHFDRLEISDTGFTYNDVFFPEASDELASAFLERVNMEIADAVIVLGNNKVQIDPVPLGKLEVGVALSNFPNLSARGSHELGGVFTTAGSSILIEPDLTSIALDLEFIPNISACPSDVYVSRSAFAREIQNREPAGITRLLNEDGVESHFFTEISGATRPTAVIHYWFADGKPVAVEELPVEPSYRWRTWSSKQIDRSLARNWEVIVVEKQTGCILHSQSIYTDPAIDAVPQGEGGLRETYERFRTEFESRVGDFSIRDEQPDIALIEVPRPFLTSVLHESVKDINIVVNFDIDKLPAQRLTAGLRPFPVDDIFCEARECIEDGQCVSGFTQCVRQRDSRECTRCLFRNPLNNRCLNEGDDPICEAARATQNHIFESRYNSCQEQEALANQKCLRRVEQKLRSCEIEATSERTACTSGRESAQEFSDRPRFADIALQLETTGGLSSVFSGFEIEGDLENIRMKLGFSGVLELSGSIRFAPRQFLGPLANCMNAWQKAFDGKVVLPYLGNSMIGIIQVGVSSLQTDWSGYVVSAPISPTPLEAMFVDNPSLLADCQIGLTIEKVNAAIEGPGSDYLAGRYPMEIQPLSSRINLALASVKFADEEYLAEPLLTNTHLKYEVRD